MTLAIDPIGHSPTPLSSAGGTRRTADAAASPPAPSVSAGTGTAAGDNLSVGKLAKALKGPAADAFGNSPRRLAGCWKGW